MIRATIGSFSNSLPVFSSKSQDERPNRDLPIGELRKKVTDLPHDLVKKLGKTNFPECIDDPGALFAEPLMKALEIHRKAGTEKEFLEKMADAADRFNQEP